MKRIFFALLLTAVFISCDDDDDAPVDNSLYQTKGYVVTSFSDNTAGYTYYAGYYESLPGSAAIDLTAKSAYNSVIIRDSHKGFLYGSSLQGENTVTKIAVTKEGKLTEVGGFPLTSYLGNIKIINDNLGIYVEWGSTPQLGTFNPETMEKTGEIDMSKAFRNQDFERNYYRHVTYRAQDNRLFLGLITDSNKTSQFYDATDVYVEVVNLTTKQWEKTAIYKGAMEPETFGNDNPIVDESGNIYIFTQGSYGLDGQMGAGAPKSSRPQILKIPAGSTEFDANYAFNPVDAFGQSGLLVQLMMGGIYDSNGIAYVAISAASESPRILELVMKFAQGTITEDEYNELRNAVFYSQNQRWVKLDLNAKTSTVIADIPLTAAYAYPFSYKYDGKFYLQFNATSEKTSGFYEYDPATGKAQKVVNVSQGGLVNYLFKLDQ
jgi:hypothetical protein